MQPIDSLGIKMFVNGLLAEGEDRGCSRVKMVHQNQLAKSKAVNRRFLTAGDEDSLRRCKEDLRGAQDLIETMGLASAEKEQESPRGRGKTYRSIFSRIKRCNGKDYREKLLEVMLNKQRIDRLAVAETMEKVEDRSYERRMQKREQNEHLRKKLRESNTVRNSIGNFLLKAFLIKTLTKPLPRGREVKIENFAQTLKL